ncbi:TBCC domain-containing protein 1 like protein [Aduncisulcus paluster]|uniref:TBCC domain-containing protein 1 like protein n=1 Tax=Aduncisulcus paluster TaxID=2918883 RepID=A0ABQ5KX57_9EUKA|nr:TBCC domain-containing protein 1 like protein [Aduncisulcus paluster]
MIASKFLSIPDKQAILLFEFFNLSRAPELLCENPEKPTPSSFTQIKSIKSVQKRCRAPACSSEFMCFLFVLLFRKYTSQKDSQTARHRAGDAWPENIASKDNRGVVDRNLAVKYISLNITLLLSSIALAEASTHPEEPLGGRVSANHLTISARAFRGLRWLFKMQKIPSISSNSTVHTISHLIQKNIMVPGTYFPRVRSCEALLGHSDEGVTDDSSTTPSMVKVGLSKDEEYSEPLMHKSTPSLASSVPEGERSSILPAVTPLTTPGSFDDSLGRVTPLDYGEDSESDEDDGLTFTSAFERSESRDDSDTKKGASSDITGVLYVNKLTRRLVVVSPDGRFKIGEKHGADLQSGLVSSPNPLQAIDGMPSTATSQHPFELVLSTQTPPLPSPASPPPVLRIAGCAYCSILVPSYLSHILITGCEECIICCGAVAGGVVVSGCTNTVVHAVCGCMRVESCVGCEIRIASAVPPIFICSKPSSASETGQTIVAPFSTFYPQLMEDIRLAGLLYCCSNSQWKQRMRLRGIGERGVQIPPPLMNPVEFLPFVFPIDLPFNGVLRGEGGDESPSDEDKEEEKGPTIRKIRDAKDAKHAPTMICPISWPSEYVDAVKSRVQKGMEIKKEILSADLSEEQSKALHGAIFTLFKDYLSNLSAEKERGKELGIELVRKGR